MRKLVVFGLCLCLVTFGTYAFAGNGSDKGSLYDSNGYTCAGGATDIYGPSLGFVNMNINANGQLIIQVSVKKGMPNTTYDVWVNQDPGACPMGAPTAYGALTTNKGGNGNAHVTTDAVAGATSFWVSVVGGGQVLRSTAVELFNKSSNKGPKTDPGFQH